MPSPATDSKRTYMNPDDVAEPNIMEYAVMRARCCEPPKPQRGTKTVNMPKYMAECTARIKSRGIKDLQLSALSGNAADSLEAGVRLYTGCTVPKNTEAAAMFWQGLVDSTATWGIPNVSRSIRARAHSCLAHMHSEICLDEDTGVLNIDSLYRAAHAADKSCELGFHSATAFLIANRVKNGGFRCNADNTRFPEHDMTRFEQLSHLWEFIDGSEDSGRAAAQERAEKLAGREESYICAAPECGIEATKKATLKQCGGPCTVPKPHYCSKECQKSDWKRHKVHCRQGADPDPSVTASLADEEITSPEVVEDEDEDSEISLRPRNLMDEPLGDDHFNTDGLERTIYMSNPNGKGLGIKLSSSTFSPAFMRELRDSLSDKLA